MNLECARGLTSKREPWQPKLGPETTDAGTGHVQGDEGTDLVDDLEVVSACGDRFMNSNELEDHLARDHDQSQSEECKDSH